MVTDRNTDARRRARDEGEGSRRIRLRLTARTRIGDAVVGCSAARLADGGVLPEAELDISEPGTAPRSRTVAPGDFVAMHRGMLRVERIHPVETSSVTGVDLIWTPAHRPPDPA